MITNSDLCSRVFDFLKACQVDTIVICAGARNAPFVFQLENQSFQTIYFFEERSAAFYAMGLMKHSKKPVAVITTSGTAAAELLPGTVESYYQGLPLILITADRPKSYRHSGAPQVIHQVGLYTNYVEQSVDWDVHHSEFKLQTSLQKPIHLNICFDEPLMDQPGKVISKLNFELLDKVTYPTASPDDFAIIKKPFVIVSQIAESKKEIVKEFLLNLKAPIYFEALSQLASDKDLTQFVIQSSDAFVKKIFDQKICGSVIRIGGVPTLRFWRDLEDKFLSVPVFNFTDLPFSGLSKMVLNYKIDFSNFESSVPVVEIQTIKLLDWELQKKKENLLRELPLSEPAFINHLSKIVGTESLYLGNSLPIREWDSFADFNINGSKNIYANRGANGIDGQISTYLGWSESQEKSWCLIGDLTALYDLASLGLAQEIHATRKRRIVVMNNRGGHIFKRIFKKDQFLNSHSIEFEMWAKMWKWDYLKIVNSADFEIAEKNLSANLVIELQPDADQTTSFWNAWDAACNQI